MYRLIFGSSINNHSYLVDAPLVGVNSFLLNLLNHIVKHLLGLEAAWIAADRVKGRGRI
jgi:hypothetical protein